MIELLHLRTLLIPGLVLIVACTTSCSSSVLGWHVRTYASPSSPPFDYRVLEREPVAIFGALGLIPIEGNEVGVENFLAEIMTKLAPRIRLIDPVETVTRINRSGFVDDYAKMHDAALSSNVLAREPLQKLGVAIGARYIFQPRLMLFRQSLTDRWVFPVFGVRVSQTRATILRMALQLWEAETGALLWSSIAEGTMQSEAMSQDPVYFSDVVRVTLGSMFQDLVIGKTDSMYTPVNGILNSLVQTAPAEQPEHPSVSGPATAPGQ